MEHQIEGKSNISFLEEGPGRENETRSLPTPSTAGPSQGPVHTILIRGAAPPMGRVEEGLGSPSLGFRKPKNARKRGSMAFWRPLQAEPNGAPLGEEVYSGVSRTGFGKAIRRLDWPRVAAPRRLAIPLPVTACCHVRSAHEDRETGDRSGSRAAGGAGPGSVRPARWNWQASKSSLRNPISRSSRSNS